MLIFEHRNSVGCDATCSEAPGSAARQSSPVQNPSRQSRWPLHPRSGLLA